MGTDGPGGVAAEHERAFRPRWGQVIVLACAHFAHDVYTALLSPWLPLLIEKLALSKLQAGSLSVFLQIPTLANPFIGWLVDRRNLVRLLVVVSPTVTAVGMSLVGMMPGYLPLAVLLLVTGLGVAGIHVSTPVAIAAAAGTRTGLGMSLHMLGGELARTAGPVI
ncbi:MAG: MFS transporter, partial [Deltaproteobacteria bacterium]